MDKININTANKKTLTDLKGIGPSTADKIIAYRKENGDFASKEDLQKVRGIGKNTYQQISTEIVTNTKQQSKEESIIEVSFNPSNYDLGDLNEVHLVGDMNDWDPADKTYSLTKAESGVWQGSFALEEGMEYKIMYDSESWEEGKHLGDENWMNLIL